jgi:two-component system, LuxR family, sensor kinase FixL
LRPIHRSKRDDAGSDGSALEPDLWLRSWIAWFPLSFTAIIVVRLDGVIVSWNAGAERLLGFCVHEMRGRSLLEIIGHDRPPEMATLLDRIRSGHSVEDTATVALTKSGTWLDVVLTTLPIPDDDGDVIRAVVVVREGAERHTDSALRESEARWRAVMDSAVDAMIVIDATGVIEDVNPATERLFGYAAAEMRGRNVSLLMPEPHRSEHDRYIADYLRTGQQHVIGIGREVTARRRDGSTCPVHLAVGEMSVGGAWHFTGILHDLTARVQLEGRVRDQTALARLGEMAAVIAHEVKNPLAAVRGAIQVIGGRLPAGSRDTPVITEIIARLDALNELIKDLLLFARTPQPRFQLVDMAALLQMTAQFLPADPALSDLRIDIVGRSAAVHGDPEFLRIVFQNLLLNAAQAMQGKGVITARLGAADGFQQVTIVDHGSGLSREARDNLFRPFFTTKARGTGLGLATARRLVELQDGSITVDSILGSGTTVTVALPVAAASAQHSEAQAHVQDL